MKSLFHLVSGQNLPAYIAAEFIKPDENVYFYTDGSRQNLEDLKRVLGGKSAEIKVDAFNFSTLIESFIGEMKKRPTDELFINFTGGTKIMSIAAFEAFRNNNGTAFYINTDNNTIIYFNGGEIKVLPMDIKIQPSVYLNLQGQKIKTVQQVYDSEYESLLESTADFIIRNLKIVYPFIMKFADKHQKIGKSVNYDAGQNSFIKGSRIAYADGIASFRFILKEKELFSVQTANIDFLHFLRGKWFETAAYIQIKKTGLFDTVDANLEIDWKGQPDPSGFGKNEIDVFAMKGIIPYVFECKSGLIKTEAINKLKAIKETFLGRFSDIFFISVHHPNDRIKERMKEQGIKYVNYYDIKNLHSYINSKNKSHIK